MLRTWLAFGFIFAAGLAALLAAPVPTGVLAQEVREELELIAASNPNMPSDQVAAETLNALRAEQKRRIVFLFSAYMAIWAAMGVYMASIARRQGRLQQEIERLRASLN